MAADPYVRVMTDQPEFEELEHIPWAALAAKRPDPRLRIGALVVVGVIAIAAGLLAASRLSSSGDTTVPAVTDTPVAPATPAATTAGVVDVVQPDPEVALPATAMYSEADLMLISIDDEERLAVMQAEWFVRDFLTIDGDDSITERVAALVPDGTPAPIEYGSSYVEWVHVFAVGSPSPGRYRIDVVYRLLVGGDEGYVREPVGAVAVEIAIAVDGSATLISIPEAIAVPVLLAMADTSE